MCPAESSAFIKYAVSIASGVITAGIGGIIGYLSARRVSSLNAKKTACASLRKAFAPAQAFIYLAKKHGSTHEVPDVDKFLRKSLLRHASAVEEFRPFVSKEQGTAYQEVWEAYRHEVRDYGFQAEESRTDIGDPWKVFENLIHKILHFADET